MVYKLKRAVKPVSVKPSRKRHTHVEDLDGKILEFANANPGFTISDIERQFRVAANTSMAHLSKLIKDGKLTREGIRGHYTHYASNVEVKSDGDIANLILEFVSKHDGEKYYRTDIASELDLTYMQVQYAIKKLIKRGLLGKDFSKGNQSQAKPAVTEPTQATQPPKKANETAFADMVFEYIRETRNTDLLSFLTWLETK